MIVAGIIIIWVALRRPCLAPPTLQPGGHTLLGGAPRGMDLTAIRNEMATVEGVIALQTLWASLRERRSALIRRRGRGDSGARDARTRVEALRQVAHLDVQVGSAPRDQRDREDRFDPPATQDPLSRRGRAKPQAKALPPPPLSLLPTWGGEPVRREGVRARSSLRGGRGAWPRAALPGGGSPFGGGRAGIRPVPRDAAEDV